MTLPQYKQEPFVFAAGPLGYLEGLRFSSQHDSTPLCHYFGGVPYALPPVDSYRFRRPRPLPESYRYGTQVSPARCTGKTALCPQPVNIGNTTDPTLVDENCLQLNIYIPTTGTKPSSGWPIFFFCHGGFLQWGSANMSPVALTTLLSETALRAIIIIPAYRLNLFGFLSGKELQAEAARDGEAGGNMGFWDQRAALEWTAKNVGHFGGDPANVTVGGYSAGSHSAFHQLAHDLYFVSDDEAIIKRVIMWSNSPGVQPRTASEHSRQFDELLGALDIPTSTSAAEKLARLRSLPAQDLIDASSRLNLSEFRATTDDSFVSANLFHNIQCGDFGRRMKRRGIRLMNGECRDENNLYQAWRTPSQSYAAVRTRLIADYPDEIVDRLMDYHCGEANALPAGVKDWQDLFGRIYANMQVHVSERNFHRALELGGLEFGKDVLRYRFDWRSKCLQDVYPAEWEVCHATDMAIWWWGLDYGDGLPEDEKEILKPWNQGFAAFVHGNESMEWGPTNIQEMKRLRADGETDVWIDDRWEGDLKVADVVYGAGNGLMAWIKAKL